MQFLYLHRYPPSEIQISQNDKYRYVKNVMKDILTYS